MTNNPDGLSDARARLAKAYQDNGDYGAAGYIRAGHDLTPDTQVALLAIDDALRTPPASTSTAIAAKPDYEPAWREMYDALSWMHGCKALSGYAGWPLGKIATDLIDHAYPDLRAKAYSRPSNSGDAYDFLREVEPVRFTDDHGNPGLLYTQQNMIDAFKAGRNSRG